MEDLADGEELVLMGHGSPHYHNPIYEYLQSFADKQKWPVHIGVVESEDYPNQQDVIDRLLAKGCQKYICGLCFWLAATMLPMI